MFQYSSLNRSSGREQTFHFIGRALVLLVGTLVTSAGSTAEPAVTAGPPGPRTLYVIRHGNYDDTDPSDEANGRHLTPIGIAQSKLLAARLRALPVRFDDFQMSPLTRARETAATIAADLGASQPRIVPDLAECTPPTQRTELTAKEKPEDLVACKAQLERLATALFQPSPNGPRNDLVVCHGNVTRWLVAKAMGVDVGSWLSMSLGHASLTVIRIQPDGRVRVLAVGDVGHLPENMQTGRIDTPERKLVVP